MLPNEGVKAENVVRYLLQSWMGARMVCGMADVYLDNKNNVIDIVRCKLRNCRIPNGMLDFVEG